MNRLKCRLEVRLSKLASNSLYEYEYPIFQHKLEELKTQYPYSHSESHSHANIVYNSPRTTNTLLELQQHLQNKEQFNEAFVHSVIQNCNDEQLLLHLLQITTTIMQLSP